jgi:hypothetical protein
LAQTFEDTPRKLDGQDSYALNPLLQCCEPANRKSID